MTALRYPHRLAASRECGSNTPDAAQVAETPRPTTRRPAWGRHDQLGARALVGVPCNRGDEVAQAMPRPRRPGRSGGYKFQKPIRVERQRLSDAQFWTSLRRRDRNGHRALLKGGAETSLRISQPLVKRMARFRATVESALTAHPHNDEALTKADS
jgi:hypothetical protein